jgi:hypothetical protein
VHSGVLEFGSDHSKTEEEKTKVVPRAFGVVRPLGFGACAFGVEGFGGNRKAKKNVGFDLACVGRAVEKAELDRSRSPNVVEVWKTAWSKSSTVWMLNGKPAKIT